MVDMFYLCGLKYNIHDAHEAIRQLKRSYCEQEIEFLIFLNLN